MWGELVPKSQTSRPLATAAPLGQTTWIQAQREMRPKSLAASDVTTTGILILLLTYYTKKSTNIQSQHTSPLLTNTSSMWLFFVWFWTNCHTVYFVESWTDARYLLESNSVGEFDQKIRAWHDIYDTHVCVCTNCVAVASFGRLVSPHMRTLYRTGSWQSLLSLSVTVLCPFLCFNSTEGSISDHSIVKSDLFFIYCGLFVQKAKNFACVVLDNVYPKGFSRLVSNLFKF